MPCENGDTAENLRMLSKTVRQSICCTIVCLCIPVSRFAVHIILDIVTYICKYIYICLHVNYICSLCLLFSMGLFLRRRKRGNQDMGLDMYSFYTCSPLPLCQRVLCMLRPSCIRCTQRWSLNRGQTGTYCVSAK